MTKTIKLLVVLGLLLGLSQTVEAVGRRGVGWNVTLATGVHNLIFNGSGFIKRIDLSSAPTADLGASYVLLITSVPEAGINGAVAGTFDGGELFLSTTQVLPALVFKTTTSVSGSGMPITHYWDAGDCDTCFIEVGSKSGGAILRMSQQSTGQAGIASVHWSK